MAAPQHQQQLHLSPKISAEAPTQVLFACTQACGVSDFKFGTSAANSLATVYKMSPPGGCQLAVCARFPTQVDA